MPGPPMEARTGQEPLQLSTTLEQHICPAVTGILHAASAGLHVLENTGPLPAEMEAAWREAKGFFLHWALSKFGRGLSLDVHWCQAKYMVSVKKKKRKLNVAAVSYL